MKLFYLIILFTVTISFSLSAQGGLISLGVGQQKVIKINNMTKIALGSDVYTAQTVGSNQILVTGKKAGRSTLIVWVTGGKRITYIVRVTQLDPEGVVKDVANLLDGIEGIKIKIAEGYIILDGEVYRPIDYLRIQKVRGIFPIVKSLVIVSPAAKKGITEQLNSQFQENGLKDIRATVIGDMIFLEGFVSDDREKIKALAIAKSLGLKKSKNYTISKAATKLGTGEGSSKLAEKLDIEDDNMGQEFIDLITVGLKKMILLDLEFVEIKKSGQLKVGLDWYSMGADMKRGPASTFSEIATTNYDVVGPDGTVVAKRPTNAVLYPSQQFNLAFMSNFNIIADLSLLSSTGYSRVLAKPKLICASGEQAKFLSGGQIPIVTTSRDGQTVTYKDFGIILDIAPIADGDGNIITKIKAEVSEPDWSNQVLGWPGFVVRKVETVVTIPTNNTIVLSGLFKFQEQKGVSKIAGLGHIPILGELFKSRDFQDGKSDLLVFVTPRIVTPDSNIVKSMIKKMKKNYEASSTEIGFSIFD